MKCSAVVDRAGGRAGRTGTEMLEWRTDRRNLSVLVKKITGTWYNMYLACVHQDFIFPASANVALLLQPVL